MYYPHPFEGFFGNTNIKHKPTASMTLNTILKSLALLILPLSVHAGQYYQSSNVVAIKSTKVRYSQESSSSTPLRAPLFLSVTANNLKTFDDYSVASVRDTEGNVIDMPKHIRVQLFWLLNSSLNYLAESSFEQNYKIIFTLESGEKHELPEVATLHIYEARAPFLLVDEIYSVHRAGMPPGFFSVKNHDVESNFWQAPLSHILKKMRGVGVKAKGSSIVKANHRVVRKVSSHTHAGIDLSAPTGTDVFAAADGVVSYATRWGAWGNLIIIDHEGGYQTYYAHLSSFDDVIAVGTPIARGMRIGAVGTTGRATGPHLHIEIRHNGRYLNPDNSPLYSKLVKIEGNDGDELKLLSALGGMQLSPLVNKSTHSFEPVYRFGKR